MKILSTFVLLCLLTTFAPPSHAIGAFGCGLIPNASFVECVLKQKDDAVAAAKAAKDAVITAKDTVIKQLEESPFMAKLQAEKDLLTHGRQGAVDLAACLSDAQLSYGTILSNAVTDPHNLVASRLQVMITEATAAQKPLLLSRLNRAKNGNPANHANMDLLIDEAFDFILTVAQQDPVTNCAVPTLEGQAQQIKQVIAQLYPKIAQKLTSYVEQSVQPLVTKRIYQMVGDELTVQTGSTSGQPSGQSKGPQTNSKARRVTTAQRRVQPAKAKSRNSSSTTSRARRGQVVSKNQPRTRAAGSFMDQVAQTGVALGNEFVQYATPDDLTRFALGEFTALALPPQVLSTTAGEISNLTAAMNNGTVGSVDTEQLTSLLTQLDLDNRDLYTRIALATLRKHGHDIIDDEGKTAIGYGVGLVFGAKAVSSEMVSAICSTGASMTGIPCAGVKAGVEFLVESVLQPTIVYVLAKHTHIEWDSLVDCGTETLLAGEDVSADCTSVVAIIPWFPDTSQEALDFVMPSLGATQQAMEKYHRAVAELVAATKSAG